MSKRRTPDIVTPPVIDVLAMPGFRMPFRGQHLDIRGTPLGIFFDAEKVTAALGTLPPDRPLMTMDEAIELSMMSTPAIGLQFRNWLDRIIVLSEVKPDQRDIDAGRVVYALRPDYGAQGPATFVIDNKPATGGVVQLIQEVVTVTDPEHQRIIADYVFKQYKAEIAAMPEDDDNPLDFIPDPDLRLDRELMSTPAEPVLAMVNWRLQWLLSRERSIRELRSELKTLVLSIQSCLEMEQTRRAAPPGSQEVH